MEEEGRNRGRPWQKGGGYGREKRRRDSYHLSVKNVDRRRYLEKKTMWLLTFLNEKDFHVKPEKGKPLFNGSTALPRVGKGKKAQGCDPLSLIKKENIGFKKKKFPLYPLHDGNLRYDPLGTAEKNSGTRKEKKGPSFREGKGSRSLIQLFGKKKVCPIRDSRALRKKKETLGNTAREEEKKEGTGGSPT